jgi:hypothetical protein
MTRRVSDLESQLANLEPLPRDQLVIRGW